MILLGLRDNELTRHLVATGKVRVDFLETGGPSAATVGGVTAVPRVLVHNAVWNWSLAHPRALEIPEILSTIRQVLERTRAPWLSVHLGFASAEVAPEGPMMAPRSPVLPRDVVRHAICTTVRKLAPVLTVPLLLENLDYWPTGAYEYVSEPAFLADVLDTTDVEFLLDLAHARVAAGRLGIPIDDYLDRLPLNRVRELHVSGPRVRDGVLMDAHESLDDEDRRLLARVLRASRPGAVTLEYDGADGAAMAAELAHLRTTLAAQPPGEGLTC